MNVEQIARVCHEANKAFCEGIYDFSQEHWDDAEQWQKDSAIAGVKYAIENPDAPDSAQHDAWCADKIKDGWCFGEVKDPIKKTHHCLVPFEDLPSQQQAKDTLFKAVCKSLLPLLW
jgi:hypothetical protein